MSTASHWNKEVKYIRNEASNKIAKWYKKNKFLLKYAECKTKKDLIRWYNVKNNERYLLYLPERISAALDVNPIVMGVLSDLVNKRSRRSIIEWALSLPLSFEDFIYADRYFHGLQ